MFSNVPLWLKNMWFMKKLDKLLLTSFIGPFIVAFCIALFVLIMQFLWLYIDEIAGKGISIFIMFELIAYLSVATFPMALPIAVLIASVMVMGNLSERYELSSMKSAGISLVRIMAPLIIFCAGVSYFSYFCSNYLIPIANLQFKSRLYDIRKQKPALTLEAGVFNEDFRQFVIRIGSKASDGETIGDVMIDDQTTAGRVKFNQILADSGQMFTTEDKHFFVMNLFDGTQYQEPAATGQNQKQKYPFIRTNFKSWQKVWDLQEFEMTSTDQNRFKDQRSMLTMQQLRANMDSLERTIVEQKSGIATDLLLLVNKKIEPPKPQPAPKMDVQLDKKTPKQASSTVRKIKKNARLRTPITNNQLTNNRINPAPLAKNDTLVKQILDKPLTSFASFIETFPADRREKLLETAAGRFRSVPAVFDGKKQTTESRRTELVKTGYELFTKYSFALICLIFLFVGAPLGSIIRKGGFGYSLLVAIISFSVFITLLVACRKLAETFILPPFWAAMMPCLVIIPVAAILTRRAMNDQQIVIALPSGVQKANAWFVYKLIKLARRFGLGDVVENWEKKNEK